MYNDMLFNQMLNEGRVNELLLCETPVLAEDFAAAKPFLKFLRAAGDPPPARIPPQPDLMPAYAEQQKCALNVARFCEENPGYQGVWGFKLWTTSAENNQGLPYLGIAHAVAQAPDGKYRNVTPEDNADTDKDVIFVPSSRLYRDVSVDQFAKIYKRAQRNRRAPPQMGAVCRDKVLWVYQEVMEGPRHYKATPEELEI